MNRVWTEEELEILRQDRAARIPIPVTAAKLGRPVPATYARARLIGTLVQPHQSWDEASVARLRELVLADPPMTDKCIAAELGRTVTQIRWKMQDLGLIGVRNLSKLAKITATKTTRPKVDKPALQTATQRWTPVVSPAASPQTAAPVREPNRAPVDARAAVERAVKTLESVLADRLKAQITASESEMIEAAKNAIAEKSRIDQRLAALVPAKAQREVAAEKVKPEPKSRPEDSKRDTGKAASQSRAPALAEAKASDPKVESTFGTHSKLISSSGASSGAANRNHSSARCAQRETAKPVAAKPPIKKAIMPAAQGISQAAPRSAPQPVQPQAPKIVVTEEPSAARPVEQDTGGPVQMSGRGGWKSVRRDPARIMAQAKAKAANRSDAVDLAQAAQAAIERFIAERGVTRTEADGIQTLVTRLQARGYIVVRDGEGWVIDQRHRVANENELTAFAEARGISLSAAA